MKKEKRLFLIDGTAFIHRAFHAIRGLSNSSGLPTNAVFGFCRMLLKLIEDRSPEYVVLLFDAKGPTFRHDLFHDYKANRPPMPEELTVQLPYIKKVTESLRLPVLEMPGYEADDLIGTLARRAEAEGFSVVMVTGDKDFLQLITEQTTIWDPMKDQCFDQKSVQESFGLRPNQLIDVMGLCGDAVDNIPGVPGIGQKTALDLIRQFGSMESLYERLEDVSKERHRENLIKFKELAFLSKTLATINTEVPLKFCIEDFRVAEPDGPALIKIFKELEFRQLQLAFKTQSDLSKKDYRSILDMQSLSKLIEQLEKEVLIAVDTETTSEDPMRAELVGLSFSAKPDEAFYIPCGHIYEGAPKQLDRGIVLEALRSVLEDTGIKKVGQNIKYDWIVLKRHGISLDGVVFDTMLASYLINPSKRMHNLDQIALDFLDYKTTTYDEVAGKGKNAKNFARVSVEKATPYACEDADITLKAQQILADKMKALGLTDLFEKVEMPLIPVLIRMEMHGVCVDIERLRELSKSFEHQLCLLEDAIYSTAGERFNVKSAQQLGHILFEKLNLPIQKKTKKKTGSSTDVDVLTALAAHHELPALILRHRSLTKLKSTYTDALLELIHPKTGRIHTSFNQTVTATGRLSSSDPNLQNIPIRTEEGRQIRSAFIAREGWFLVSADYSQIELRILAHCSEDELLVRSFIEDEDIHTRTAVEVFQVSPSLLTPELRRQAKVINFGIIYGMGSFSLSKELGISQKMAKTFIDHYFTRYRGVKRYIDRTIEDARKSQQTGTLLGRIRQIPDINSANRNMRQFAERTAINTPIQGTAADLIKIAMVRVDQTLREKELKTAMILSVHDELVFEAPSNELEIVCRIVKETMESVWDLKVPLKVNVQSGKNWAQAH